MAIKSKLRMSQIKQTLASGEDVTFTGAGGRQLLKLDENGNTIIGDGAAGIVLDGAISGTQIGLGAGKIVLQKAGVADNQYLRIDGTVVEGVAAADVRTDISAEPASDRLTELATMALNTAQAMADLSNAEVALLDGASAANNGAGKAAILDASQHLVLNNKQIQGVANPTADGHAANKAYVDSVAEGLEVKDSVVASTHQALPNCTYHVGNMTLTGDSNGALSAQDGITLTINQRLLVRHQVDQKHNGIYELSTVGDGGNPFVLTRAKDYNLDSEISPGTFTFVEQGTAGADQGFVMSNHEFTAINSSSGNQGKIQWTQFSGAGAITAGNGLEKSGNQLSVDLKTNGGIVLEGSDMKIDVGQSAVEGTLPVVRGGSGQTSYSDGQLLIGNSSGNTLAKATLTGGSGVTVTNGNGSISVAVTRKNNAGLVDDSGELKIDLAQSAVEGVTRFSGATKKKSFERAGSQLAADADHAISDGGGFTAADFMAAAEFDREIYLNGQLLMEGADASANLDWYEGSGSNLKFEFPLEIGDIVTCVYRKT